MISGMVNIAAECLRNPRQPSLWSAELGKYICPTTPDSKAALKSLADFGRSLSTKETALQGPRLDPQFKLVIVTSAGGTCFFLVLCVATTIIAG